MGAYMLRRVLVAVFLLGSAVPAVAQREVGYWKPPSPTYTEAGVTVPNMDGCGHYRTQCTLARRNDHRVLVNAFCPGIAVCEAKSAQLIAEYNRNSSPGTFVSLIGLIFFAILGIGTVYVLWRYFVRPVGKGALAVAGATHALVSKHPVERVLPDTAMSPINPNAYRSAMREAERPKSTLGALLTPAFVDEDQIANAKRAKAKAEQHVELNTAVIRREVGISDATSERLYSKQVADEEAKYEAERRRILAEHDAANHPAASPGLLIEAAHMLAKPVEQRDRVAFTDMAMKLFETALDLRRTSNAANADAHEHMARQLREAAAALR